MHTHICTCMYVLRESCARERHTRVGSKRLYW